MGQQRMCFPTMTVTGWSHVSFQATHLVLPERPMAKLEPNWARVISTTKHAFYRKRVPRHDLTRNKRHRHTHSDCTTPDSAHAIIQTGHVSKPPPVPLYTEDDARSQASRRTRLQIQPAGVVQESIQNCRKQRAVLRMGLERCWVTRRPHITRNQ